MTVWGGPYRCDQFTHRSEMLGITRKRLTDPPQGDLVGSSSKSTLHWSPEIEFDVRPMCELIAPVGTTPDGHIWHGPSL